MTINSRLINRLKHFRPKWVSYVQRGGVYDGSLYIYDDCFIGFAGGNFVRIRSGMPVLLPTSEIGKLTHINQVIAFIETEIAIRSVR